MLHLLFVSLTLFYVTSAFNGRCANMTTVHKPDCEKVLNEVYNYTIGDLAKMRYLHAKITEERIECKLEGVCPTPRKSVINNRVDCVGGEVTVDDTTYECNNVDLLSFVSLTALGSSGSADGNDIWGYTNADGEHFAITGQTDGASIVDVTDPVNPEVLCFIPARVSTNTLWRDIKVSKNSQGVSFAFIVADRSGQGLQWVALDAAITKCRAQSTKPYRMQEGEDFGWVGSPIFSGNTNTHNIVGNYEEDKVYLVGSGSCSGGLIKVDTSSVEAGNYGESGRPTLDGCYPNDGYSHDAECVTYSGPDTRFTGREICWGYNENSITVVDYSGPTAQLLSRLTYTTSRYTHQGWVNPSAVEGIQAQRFALMNDELDESGGTVSSQTTYVVDYLSLTDPVLVPWASGISSIDHNLYIRGRYVYEANYRAGLRILDISQMTASLPQNKLRETGFFKTWTGQLANSFNGAWSSYPYFGDDGNGNPEFVVVQDIEQGLFVLDVSDALEQ